MKRLIIAALLIVGMTSFAQDKKETGKTHDRAEREKFTPEQRNQLMLKKTTLELDLNASQQKEMGAIIAEKTAKREAGMMEVKANKEAGKKLTSDEMFARKNKMLDEQIVMKDRMKKILNPEQFKKWEEMQAHKQGAMKRGMMHRRAEKGETMPK